MKPAFDLSEYLTGQITALEKLKIDLTKRITDDPIKELPHGASWLYETAYKIDWLLRVQLTAKDMGNDLLACQSNMGALNKVIHNSDWAQKSAKKEVDLWIYVACVDLYKILDYCVFKLKDETQK